MTAKPEKDESLAKQFGRTLSRWKHKWKGEAVTLDDIGTIKLPAVSVNDYFYGFAPSYFATRTAGGKWNVEEQQSYGGEVPVSVTRLASGLDLPAALDLLAQKNPVAMVVDSEKFWHPVSVAKLVGHTINWPGAAAQKNDAKPSGMAA